MAFHSVPCRNFFAWKSDTKNLAKNERAVLIMSAQEVIVAEVPAEAMKKPNLVRLVTALMTRFAISALQSVLQFAQPAKPQLDCIAVFRFFCRHPRIARSR